MTKRRIPHHHLIIGPVQGEVNCWDGRFDIKQYRERFDKCECLSHSFARPWYEVTGDSYIVHTLQASAGEGAGRYMGKYLQKTFGMEGRLKALGMDRRWSSSKGWPGGGRMRLATKDWDLIVALPGHKTARELGSSEEILQREGEELTAQLGAKRHHRRNVEYLRRHADVANDSP